MQEHKIELIEELEPSGERWYYVRINGTNVSATQEREEALQRFSQAKKKMVTPYKKSIGHFETYKGFTIETGSPYGYQWAHPDYDGAPDYADGSPTDPRCGYGSSVEQCKEEIDEVILTLQEEQND